MVFSECFIKFKNDEYFLYAKYAYEFLMNMADDEYGGIYWTADFSGKPLDTAKYTYSQAFAIYALSSYYKASKDDVALDFAVDLFKLIELKCRDDFGFGEAFNRNFNPAINKYNRGKGIPAKKNNEYIASYLRRIL